MVVAVDELARRLLLVDKFLSQLRAAETVETATLVVVVDELARRLLLMDKFLWAGGGAGGRAGGQSAVPRVDQQDLFFAVDQQGGIADQQNRGWPGTTP